MGFSYISRHFFIQYIFLYDINLTQYIRNMYRRTNICYQAQKLMKVAKFHIKWNFRGLLVVMLIIALFVYQPIWLSISFISFHFSPVLFKSFEIESLFFSFFHHFSRVTGRSMHNWYNVEVYTYITIFPGDWGLLIMNSLSE